MSAEGAADPGAAGGASAWPRRLTAEAFGTFALLFIAVSGGEVSVAARAVAPGRLVAALIYAIGDVSGAHLNPAVSLAFTLKRLFPVRWLVPYDWEWTDELLVEAQRRLASWSAWALRGRSAGTTGILDELRVALMHDLDTPAAVAAVDARAAGGSASAEGDLAVIDALLGIRL